MHKKITNIDEFIDSFPSEVRQTLITLRATIKKAAPESQESISYGIPTFKLNGNLVHFSAYKNHIGFYPGSHAIEVFKKDLSPHELSKGTVRFSIDKPLPLPLITKIVKFRVEENLAKAKR